MEVKISENFSSIEMGIRIRAILGVPEEILDDETISSPTFILKAERYLNKSFEKYEAETVEPFLDLMNIAYLYYICYLLCSGMYARLPKQMENISTKTIMQNIDWDSKALDMLSKCDDTIDEILSEIDDSYEFGNTFAVLSDESQYPNTSI